MTFNAKGVTEIVKNIVFASYSTKDASRNCTYVLKQLLWWEIGYIYFKG